VGRGSLYSHAYNLPTLIYKVGHFIAQPRGEILLEVIGLMLENIAWRKHNFLSWREIRDTMVTSRHRLERMRKSFEENKSVLADDYAYFTTPRESTRQNKAARKSAERSERQSREPSEKQSSDKSDD
jgi:hypothetical protein